MQRQPKRSSRLYLHGGPGSGCTPGSRRYFDPERFRIICLDQRGCGRSRPLASDDTDLRFNTTAHLIADIEHLRRRLGVDRWIVVGVSWGTTLALAYAQQNPQCVRGIVLALVTTTSRREVQWITHDVGRISPEQFQRFREFVPAELRAVPIVDAYAKMLFDPDSTLRNSAARSWCDWEDAHVSLAPGARPNPRYRDEAFRFIFARLVTHYWRHESRIASVAFGRLADGRHDLFG